MKKLLIGLKLRGIVALSLVLVILLSSQFPARAQVKNEIPEQVMEVRGRAVDERTVILKDYLSKYNSPLEQNAQDFVDAADIYGVDWRLVAAISGVESTFGKRTPGNAMYPSFNAWGWGVYGDQSLGFKSWRHGIFTVTEGLRKNYINRGYTEPYSMNRIYASSPVWGSKVSYFLADIDKHAAKVKAHDELTFKPVNLEVSESGNSASLGRNYLSLNI